MCLVQGGTAAPWWDGGRAQLCHSQPRCSHPCQGAGKLCPVSVRAWETAPSSAWVSPAASQLHCPGAGVPGRAVRRLPSLCPSSRPAGARAGASHPAAKRQDGPGGAAREQREAKGSALLPTQAPSSSPHSITRHSHALSHRVRDFSPLDCCLKLEGS